VVLQGVKRIRMGEHELVIDPRSMIVFTRDVEYRGLIEAASRNRSSRSG
jgi:hypothetical protein